MIRAAAKNHEDVTVVVDPEDYAELLRHLGPLPDQASRANFRRLMAWKAFQHTAAYDALVSEWLWDRIGASCWPPRCWWHVGRTWVPCGAHRQACLGSVARGAIVGAMWGAHGCHLGHIGWPARGPWHVGESWVPCGVHMGAIWGTSAGLLGFGGTWGNRGCHVGRTWVPFGAHRLACSGSVARGAIVGAMWGASAPPSWPAQGRWHMGRTWVTCGRIGAPSWPAWGRWLREAGG
jgi:AICARFT/IMPCHase bienzyme